MGWKSDGARELVLYADNDQGIWRRQADYVDNMRKKIAKGTYKRDLGIKLWMYYVDFAAKNYTREHGSMGDKWNVIFPRADRLEAAEHYEEVARAKIRGIDRDASRKRTKTARRR